MRKARGGAAAGLHGIGADLLKGALNWVDAGDGMRKRVNILAPPALTEIMDHKIQQAIALGGHTRPHPGRRTHLFCCFVDFEKACDPMCASAGRVSAIVGVPLGARRAAIVRARSETAGR